jgi:hypothetical protein
MKSLQAPFNRLLVGAAFGLLAGHLGTLPAHAVVVNLSGNSYDVLVANRSYDGDPSLFNTTTMPWFTGDSANNSLAYDFAQAVYNQLGSNAYPGFAGLGGPLFAYAYPSPSVSAVFQDVADLAVQLDLQVSGAGTFSYAYVSAPAAATTAVPGPLPFAGAALGFAWSRSLRSRVRRSRP